jgi:hypothetical protein
MEIISKGQAVQLSESEIQEVPKNNWFRYNQLRLTMNHKEAIGKLIRKCN